ncbi:Hypothetical predicted protein [Cloeon dipterum]|uniref:Uncharacterized protein n=1 Tax=Cloeon dipterum TaxID=197152 RepID=A0A8S1E177_9INSE|nr:Hypothetical predicted protein [Cloeon dipterum]
MRVLKEGKTPSPELIREKIGPAVLKQIRFLTMTGIEFSRVHTSAQLLTYEEGLAILLNINNPGVLEIPKSLSSLTQKRKNRATITRTLKTFGVYTSTWDAMKEEKRTVGAAGYLMYPYRFTFHSYNDGRYRLLYNPNFVYAIVTV